jgi:hypothetical protein
VVITRILAIILLVGAVASAAQANTITLTVPDLAGYSGLSSTDPATITVNNGIIPAGTAVTLTTDFAPPQIGLQSASVGLAGQNIAFNGGDSFCLNLENTNENTWTFQLVTVTDQGTFMSATQSLAPDMDASFSAALGGVAGTISSSYFVVSGILPFSDGDRTAEYQVAPVPEPASLTLLVLGATCLAGRWRR